MVNAIIAMAIVSKATVVTTVASKKKNRGNGNNNNNKNNNGNGLDALACFPLASCSRAWLSLVTTDIMALSYCMVGSNQDGEYRVFVFFVQFRNGVQYSGRGHKSIVLRFNMHIWRRSSIVLHICVIKWIKR
jgi:hypothetical protein